MIYTDLIFVFAFLPVCVIFLYCSSEGWSRNIISLAASLIFLIWGRSACYALLVLPVLFIYFCGRMIKKSALFEFFGGLSAAASSLAAIICLPEKNSLLNALLSVGLILFAFRSAWYLKGISEGGEPETDFLSLAVYLISFENMLAAPLYSYEDLRGSLKERKPSLARSSAGLPLIIKGLAIAGVCGLSFDAVRLSATEYEAFPWANAVILFLISSGEAYVVTAGILDISRGISLIEGFGIRPATPAFIPKARLIDHLDEFWQGIGRAVKECFCDRSKAGFLGYILALSFMTGLLIGFGAGAAGAFCLIILGAALSARSEGVHSAVSAIFSVIIVCAAFLVISFGSVGGISEAFSALNPNLYDYDITYILNYQLMRKLPWLIVGLIAISPLRRFAVGMIRRKMSEGGKAYLAIKIIETVFCAVVLVIFAAAALE